MRHYQQEEARARLNELFRRKLEAAKAKGFQRTQVGRREIVRQVPELNEAVGLALEELKRNWTLIEPPLKNKAGVFLGAWYTEVSG
jgi:hypothetical protein